MSHRERNIDRILRLNEKDISDKTKASSDEFVITLSNESARNSNKNLYQNTKK